MSVNQEDFDFLPVNYPGEFADQGQVIEMQRFMNAARPMISEAGRKLVERLLSDINDQLPQGYEFKLADRESIGHVALVIS